MNRLRTAVLVPAPFLAVVAISLAALAQTTFEPPPVLSARNLVDPSLLSGEHHEVDDLVENDGVMNRFTIRSDFGDFVADSELMLEIRIREIAAIAKLREVSQTEAFSQALQSAAMKPIAAAEQLVTQPKETVKALPSGVSRAARGLFYKSRKVAHKVEKAVKEEGEGEGEEKAQIGREGEGDAPQEEKTNMDRAEKEIQDQIGYTRARRDLAARLKVDPYSSNEVLQKELSRLAKGAFAGGLTFSFTMPAVDAIGYVEDVTSLVWEVSPNELERRNNLALKEMGVSKDVRLEFFDNRFWSTTLETSFTAALRVLENVEGRDQFVELATAADSLVDSRRLVLSAAILAHYHNSEKPLVHLEIVTNDTFGSLITGATQSGRYVVPAAADYLIWQEGLSGGVLELVREKDLLLSGELSPRARQEMERRGWTIYTDFLPEAAAGLM